MSMENGIIRYVLMYLETEAEIGQIMQDQESKDNGNIVRKLVDNKNFQSTLTMMRTCRM